MDTASALPVTTPAKPGPHQRARLVLTYLLFIASVALLGFGIVLFQTQSGTHVPGLVMAVVGILAIGALATSLKLARARARAMVNGGGGGFYSGRVGGVGYPDGYADGGGMAQQQQQHAQWFQQHQIWEQRRRDEEGYYQQQQQGFYQQQQQQQQNHNW